VVEHNYPILTHTSPLTANMASIVPGRFSTFASDYSVWKAHLCRLRRQSIHPESRDFVHPSRALWVSLRPRSSSRNESIYMSLAVDFESSVSSWRYTSPNSLYSRCSYSRRRTSINAALVHSKKRSITYILGHGGVATS